MFTGLVLCGCGFQSTNKWGIIELVLMLYMIPVMGKLVLGYLALGSFN
jgi:hypothetical protein